LGARTNNAEDLIYCLLREKKKNVSFFLHRGKERTGASYVGGGEEAIGGLEGKEKRYCRGGGGLKGGKGTERGGEKNRG